MDAVQLIIAVFGGLATFVAYCLCMAASFERREQRWLEQVSR